MHHAGGYRRREGVSVIRPACHNSNDREELPAPATVIVNKSMETQDNQEAAMTRDEILKTPSMPAFAPSSPHGPFRFVRREYSIITDETDPNVMRAALPEPL